MLPPRRSRGLLTAVLVTVLGLAALTACKPSGSLLKGDEGASVMTPAASPSPSAEESKSPSPPRSPSHSAAPGPDSEPAPRRGSCYRLTYDAAALPTSDEPPVSCRGTHTTYTFRVGTLDTFVGGHLLAVDSHAVESQLSSTCPTRLAALLGGSVEDRALSMFKTVWFRPTVPASDAGARWYRCDLVALRGQGRLAPLPTRPRGILDHPARARRFALCATAAPGAPGFSRVICSDRHSWRALATIRLKDGNWPGVSTVRKAGEDRCRSIVRTRVGGLKFKFGWEWPSHDQWDAGQHYGYCWTSD